MARAINRITAVLAGGIPQHVTRGCTEFGRLRQVWLTPLPLPVVPSRGLSPKCHCLFGKPIGTDAGAGCSGEWFSWGEVDDRQQPRWEEREREEQHSIQRLGAPVGKGGEGERLPFTEERRDFPLSLLNSKTPNAKSAVDLCFYRSLRSGHWNKSSCGAPGGMLYMEFMNKVRPVSPPVLVGSWKYGCVHVKTAGARLHADMHI